MNILEKILAHKKKEVEKRKKERSVTDLEKERFFNRSTFSLTK